MSADDLALARLAELAVDYVLDELTANELKEYSELRAQHPEFDPYEIEQAAALMHLVAGVVPEPLPERLLVPLSADAHEFLRSRTQKQRVLPESTPAKMRPIDADRSRRAPWIQYGGWLAAAASLLWGVWSNVHRPRDSLAAASLPQEITVPKPSEPSRNPIDVRQPIPPVPPLPLVPGAGVSSLAADRGLFLKEHPFVWQRAWRPGTDPAGQRVTGDVAWDPKTQSGYMRFRGLRRNNPIVEQYQLWIFDARRDDRFPVDGGVFDVTDSGDDVVAIQSKLHVEVPLMFVITVERRGGVVVSDRQRVAAVASSG
jgi:hypothetical protein